MAQARLAASAILTLFLIAAPMFVSAQGSSIEITIYPDKFNREVTIGQKTPGTTELKANISVENPDMVNVNVDISVKGIMYGWHVEVVPTMMVFTSTDKQPLTVTVTVPAGTPAAYVELVRLEATATWSSGSTKVSYQWGVNAKQYYGANFTYRASGTGPGYRQYGYTVKNTGNGPDTYTAAVMGEAALANQHIDVSMSSTSYYLGRTLNVNQTSREIRVSVNYKGSEQSVSQDIIIRITSNGAFANHVKPDYWDFIIRFEYKKEQVSNYFIIGIVAFIVIIAVILAMLMKAPKKKRPLPPKP